MTLSPTLDRPTRKSWLIPLLVALTLIVVLVGLRVNQYSVGMYGTPRTSATVGGVDRPIRSDEWMVRLPWLMSQSARGFPTTLVTAGTHDASITYDLPVRSAQMILKPHLLPYLFLDIERGVSAEWWILVIGSALAVYILLLTLRVRPAISVPLALLVAANPGMHWWTVNASFVVTMYGCLATASMISALQEPGRKTRMKLTVTGGWLFSCAVVGLYPPFQIPVLGAFAAILIVYALEGRRIIGVKGTVSALAAAVSTMVVLLGWFVFRHRTGLQTMANTVYPGTRRVHSGGLDLVGLLGAPFDLHSSAITSGSVNRTNQSENATTFLFALPAVLLTGLGLTSRPRSISSRLQAVVVGWFVLLMMWMLLPLPDFVGSMTLLNRVPPERIKPVIVVVSAIVLALHLQFHNAMVPARARVGVVLMLMTVTVWSGTHYVVNDARISNASVWLSTIIWCLPLAAAFVRFPRAGLWVLAFVSVFTAQRINPFHNSLDPIQNNSVVSAMRKVDPNLEGTWLTFSGPAQLKGVMVSTGVRVDSATSPYPDKAFWRRFDPAQIFESAWNRYGHVRMVIGRGPSDITNPQADVIDLTVDPCGVSSPIEPGTFMIEADVTTIPCAVQVEKFDYLGIGWYVLRKEN